MALGAPQSSAQITDVKITEAERAVFAYFKLARQEPDFDRWIRRSPAYAQWPTDLQETFYERELLRLKWGFGTTHLDETYLTITSPGTITLQGPAGQGELFFTFAAGNGSEMPYFPYPYGAEAVTLIVNDFARYLARRLTPEQDLLARRALGPAGSAPGKIRLRIKPVRADSETPLELDGLKQWLMMGDVAKAEYLASDTAGQDHVVWTYTAPDYYTETEKALLPLLQQQDPENEE